MKKLRKEIIFKTEEQLLSDSDLAMLTALRNKNGLFLLYSYLPLAAILLYVFINGVSVIYREKYGVAAMSREPGDEDIEMFHQVAPFACGFFFILLTIFFIRYYLQTLAPLLRDLKHKKSCCFILFQKKQICPCSTDIFFLHP